MDLSNLICKKILYSQSESSKLAQCNFMGKSSLQDWHRATACCLVVQHTVLGRRFESYTSTQIKVDYKIGKNVVLTDMHTLLKQKSQPIFARYFITNLCRNASAYRVCFSSIHASHFRDAALGRARHDMDQRRHLCINGLAGLSSTTAKVPSGLLFVVPKNKLVFFVFYSGLFGLFQNVNCLL